MLSRSMVGLSGFIKEFPVAADAEREASLGRQNGNQNEAVPLMGLQEVTRKHRLVSSSR